MRKLPAPFWHSPSSIPGRTLLDPVSGISEARQWRILGQLAGERGMPFVCVQTLMTSWARRSEDLTFDKTDEKDAVLIARLTAQLRCYVPEPVDETWGRLRHLGARRDQLIAESTSQVQQMRDLLECVWPAALDTAKKPFRSVTWPAAMSVNLDRTVGPGKVRGCGAPRGRPRGWAESVSADRTTAVRRSRRSCWGACPPARRTGTGTAATAGLARDRTTPGRHRSPNDLRPGRAAPERAGHLYHRPVRFGCGGDPRRDRGPHPIRHLPGVGQTRGPRAAGEDVRDVRRPHQTHRPRQTRATPSSVAGGLGSSTRQPGL